MSIREKITSGCNEADPVEHIRRIEVTLNIRSKKGSELSAFKIEGMIRPSAISGRRHSAAHDAAVPCRVTSPEGKCVGDCFQTLPDEAHRDPFPKDRLKHCLPQEIKGISLIDRITAIYANGRLRKHECCRYSLPPVLIFYEITDGRNVNDLLLDGPTTGKWVLGPDVDWDLCYFIFPFTARDRGNSAYPQRDCYRQRNPHLRPFSAYWPKRSGSAQRAREETN